ncbi:MAG TPA: hypothetical protein VKT78_00330 [Fimbriimonadaceae bacterium]|nr:hypothetical protein [Fimbriimonadaceae bacterium]
MKGFRYARFDRFGFAPPSFVIGPEDDGLVADVMISIGGRTGTWPALTEAGRARYERDNGGPHPQGWATSPDIIKG